MFSNWEGGEGRTFLRRSPLHPCRAEGRARFVVLAPTGRSLPLRSSPPHGQDPLGSPQWPRSCHRLLGDRHKRCEEVIAWELKKSHTRGGL